MKWCKIKLETVTVTTSTKPFFSLSSNSMNNLVQRDCRLKDYDPRRRARAACDIDKSRGCLRLADFIGRLIDGVLSL